MTVRSPEGDHGGGRDRERERGSPGAVLAWALRDPCTSEGALRRALDAFVVSLRERDVPPEQVLRQVKALCPPEELRALDAPRSVVNARLVGWTIEAYYRAR